MHIIQRSYAGTLESSDLLVEIGPTGHDQLEIQITSSVEKQFEPAIREAISATLSELGVTSGKIVVNDKGALDCVIRARVQAAAMRAAKDVNDIVWGAV